MIKRLAALALSLLFAGPAAAQTARIDAGQIKGVSAAGVEQFLGLPYAAPPVGPLRWAAPAPANPWTGVRDATVMAKPCAGQANGDGPRYTNEDCLYLNIYRPAGAKPGDRLPVMVFLHGGAHLWGSPNIYDGSRMAQIGHAVVVIPAFRIGVFGALALPDQGGGGGGYSLQDQIAALSWVRRNAAALGGNAADVTVLGQSAGASDVCALLAAPTAKGLFRQAIMESGACRGRPSLERAQGLARDFGAALGCAADKLAACLKAADPGRVLDAWKGPGASPFGNAVLPQDPAAVVAAGGGAAVPVLIGFTRDEQWPYQHGLYPLSQGGFEAKLTERYGARAAQVAALYKPADFPHIEYALGAAAGDAGTVCSTFALAGQMAAHYPTSAYEFADRTTPPFKSLGPPQPLPPGYQPGAFHTSELQFILGYKAAMRDLDAAQRTRGDAMIRLWVGFNRGAAWPAYSASGEMMRFDDKGAAPVPATAIFDSHHCGFWNGTAA